MKNKKANHRCRTFQVFIS